MEDAPRHTRLRLIVNRSFTPRQVGRIEDQVQYKAAAIIDRVRGLGECDFVSEIAAAMQSGIPVTKYAPRKIKQSITGNGNAGKEQVWKMLQQVLEIKLEIVRFDASDALAVALCHHYQFRSPVSTEKKLTGWNDFIAKNPKRVI